MRSRLDLAKLPHRPVPIPNMILSLDPVMVMNHKLVGMDLVRYGPSSLATAARHLLSVMHLESGKVKAQRRKRLAQSGNDTRIDEVSSDILSAR